MELVPLHDDETTIPLTPHPSVIPLHNNASDLLLNSLIGGKKFVEGSGSSHLHDQHQVLSVAQAQHANNVAITQLVHDLCLPHHLLLYQLLVVTLQHFDCHISLASESKHSD